MESFNFRSTGKELRKDLCIVAYRMGLARQVAEGEITTDEARDLLEVAVDNIRTFGLAVDAHQIMFALTGIDKLVMGEIL